MLVALTITLCISGNYQLTAGQNVCFILGYVFVALLNLSYLVIYLRDKHKKIAQLNNGFIFYLIFALIMSALTYAINMFAGMDVNNVSSYIASLFIPIEFTIILVLKPILNKFLSKFSAFYK